MPGARMAAPMGGRRTPAPDGTSFATATPIQLTTGQAAATGALSPATTASAYFKLSGTKGARLRITAQATPDHVPFTAGYIDTVVTVFDSQQNLVAENNDPVDNSSTDALLLTVLAADGDYFVRVVDCNAWERKTTCAPGPITHDTFALYADTVENALPGLTNEHAEPDDTLAAAAPLTYTPPALAIGAGQFRQPNDTDWFLANYPSQNISAGRRSMAFFLPMPSGTTASGSTSVGRDRDSREFRRRQRARAVCPSVAA